jgi:hypothetical protein
VLTETTIFIIKMWEAHGTRKHGEASLKMHNRNFQYIYYLAEYRYTRRQRKHWCPKFLRIIRNIDWILSVDEGQEQQWWRSLPKHCWAQQ